MKIQAAFLCVVLDLYHAFFNCVRSFTFISNYTEVKTMKKKILLLVFVMCILTELVPILVKAEDITYEYLTFNSAVGKITKCASEASGDIIIPSEINGFEVKQIESGAFYQCEYIKSITIPNSVQNIGNGVFFGCSQLERINIPYGIKSIGDATFKKCENLKYIEIPNSVTSIGTGAFEGCLSIESIIIPNSVVQLGEGAFQLCISLKNIKISDSITSIEPRLFSQCRSLNEITIPDTVSNIGNSAFSECSSLENIIIPDGVCNLGEWTFSDCINLSTIVMPKSIENIEWKAFDACNRLSDVYYRGNKNDWSEIKIDEHNETLLNAAIHYNTINTQPPQISGEPIIDNEDIIIKLTDVGYDCILITVFFDNEEITCVNSTIISAGDIEKSFDIPDNSTNAKIFIWDSFIGMRPLCKAKTINIE